MVDPHLLSSELPLVLAVYVLVTFISNLQVRSWWMLVFPLYVLMQSMLIPLAGVCYYVVLARRQGRLATSSATDAARPPGRSNGSGSSAARVAASLLPPRPVLQALVNG